MRGDHPTLNRRSVLRGFGVGFVALTGCTSLTEDSSGSHLRIGVIQPPITLDPIAARYVGSFQAIKRIFDGLYTYSTGTDIVPKIANGHPTLEGSRKILVEIDSDAMFQNGRSVTPADIRYSFETPEEEDTAAQWAVSPIDSVETVDGRTVRFHLDHPYPNLNHALTRSIVPHEAREADRDSFARKPTGAGPYRAQSFSEEKKIVLTRWDGFWVDPTPAIDTVTLLHIKSPITQLTSLVSGQTNAIQPISPQFRNDIRDFTGASVAERPGFRLIYYGFNLNEGPTTDPAVREGIVRCIDIDKAVTEFVEPLGRRQYSLLPRRIANEWGFPVEKWKAAIPQKDLDGARRFFQRADRSIDKLTILTPTDPVWRELGEALASGLRDAGQSVIVDAVGWNRYLERFVTGAEDDYSVFVGEVTGSGDPDSFLYPVFHENTQGATNGIFYHEESVMNRLLAARRTTDRMQRVSLYDAAITRLIKDRIHLPICSFQNSFAHDPRIQNFHVHSISELNPRVTSPDGVMRVEER